MGLTYSLSPSLIAGEEKRLVLKIDGSGFWDHRYISKKAAPDCMSQEGSRTKKSQTQKHLGLVRTVNIT